jgi:hypothetical protein
VCLEPPADGITGGRGTLRQAALPPPCAYTFRYRTVSFCVPADWYTDYVLDWHDIYRKNSAQGAGSISSVSDALDLLWPTFLPEADGTHETSHHLLGCYNLHRDEHWDDTDPHYVYQFWSSSWGAPHKFYLYTIQLIRTYWQHLELEGNADMSDAFGWCERFPKFVRNMLRDESYKRSNNYSDSGGRDTCFITLNFRNTQSEYARVGAGCGGDESACDEFNHDSGCGGEKWYAFKWQWVSDEGCYTGRSDLSDCERPKSGCENQAIGGHWNATFHPVHLAWYGLVSDRILNLARMALDYSIHLAQESSVAWDEVYALHEDAVHLARYPLRMMVDYGHTIVHEIGHSWLGTGHCADQKNCCFDAAGRAWACRVMGHLGLPHNVYEAYGSDDYPGTYRYDAECESCGSGYYWGCGIDEVGVPYQDARFYAWDCGSCS